MPIDFNKLRDAKKQPPVIDPVEIFRRLPKKAEIKDLYGSQTEVLNAWFADRANPDHVVKLHTGGGKTLVEGRDRPSRTASAGDGQTAQTVPVQARVRRTV